MYKTFTTTQVALSHWWPWYLASVIQTNIFNLAFGIDSVLQKY